VRQLEFPAFIFYKTEEDVMAFSTLRYDTEGDLGIITLNRPDRLNALNSGMVRELSEVVDLVDSGQAMRVVVITGEGRAFCAGADIKERAENPEQMNILRSSRVLSPLFRRMERMSTLFIAAVNGPAIGGGCELAMACDIRIAVTGATFALPEVRLGILPGAGGTQRLPRLIGTARALEMMLMGRFITADEAFDWGLANRVVAPDDLMTGARSMAGELLAMAPLSLSVIKETVDVGSSTDLDSGLRYEQRSADLLAVTEDRREGYQAFVEKRKPIFQGR
jgi:enoyl-CoA hydratase